MLLPTAYRCLVPTNQPTAYRCSFPTNQHGITYCILVFCPHFVPSNQHVLTWYHTQVLFPVRNRYAAVYCLQASCNVPHYQNGWQSQSPSPYGRLYIGGICLARPESLLFPCRPYLNYRQEGLSTSDDYPGVHSNRRSDSAELLHDGERRHC
jgi:hypothetical protein